jgi:hypothetical protein
MSGRVGDLFLYKADNNYPLTIIIINNFFPHLSPANSTGFADGGIDDEFVKSRESRHCEERSDEAIL